MSVCNFWTALRPVHGPTVSNVIFQNKHTVSNAKDKKYVSLAGRQNASERQHKLLLSVFAAVNKKKLVKEQNSAYICAMSTLLVNSTSVGPHNYGYNKKYATNHLFPFAGQLSGDKFGVTLRDIHDLSQIFKQITEITKQRNLRKLPHLDNYMKKI